MADPPVEVGMVQLTVACALPAVAVTEVGAPGVVIGIAVSEVDEGPAPAALFARTANV